MTREEHDTLQTPACREALVGLMVSARSGAHVTAADGAKLTGLSVSTFVKVWLFACKPLFKEYLGAGEVLN